MRRPYNNKSDVWALGCILYEMLTLHRPFHGSSLEGLMAAICKGKYAPIPDAYSNTVHVLVGEMLQLDPRDRPSISHILRSVYAPAPCRPQWGPAPEPFWEDYGPPGYADAFEPPPLPVRRPLDYAGASLPDKVPGHTGPRRRTRCQPRALARAPRAALAPDLQALPEGWALPGPAEGPGLSLRAAMCVPQRSARAAQQQLDRALRQPPPPARSPSPWPAAQPSSPLQEPLQQLLQHLLQQPLSALLQTTAAAGAGDGAVAGAVAGVGEVATPGPGAGAPHAAGPEASCAPPPCGALEGPAQPPLGPAAGAGPLQAPARGTGRGKVRSSSALSKLTHHFCAGPGPDADPPASDPPPTAPVLPTAAPDNACAASGPQAPAPALHATASGLQRSPGAGRGTERAAGGTHDSGTQTPAPAPAPVPDSPATPATPQPLHTDTMWLAEMLLQDPTAEAAVGPSAVPPPAPAGTDEGDAPSDALTLPQLPGPDVSEPRAHRRVRSALGRRGPLLPPGRAAPGDGDAGDRARLALGARRASVDLVTVADLGCLSLDPPAAPEAGAGASDAPTGGAPAHDPEDRESAPDDATPDCGTGEGAAGPPAAVSPGAPPGSGAVAADRAHRQRGRLDDVLRVIKQCHRGAAEWRCGQGSIRMAVHHRRRAPPPPDQGFFRIIKNQGGGASPKTPSPPPQTKVTIVGKNEIYNRENVVRPFLVHQVLGPKPPPPLPPSPPPAQKKPPPPPDPSEHSGKKQN